MIADLIAKNRSYRRFYQEIEVSTESMEKLVDMTRLSASGANKIKNEQIFDELGWATYR